MLISSNFYSVGIGVGETWKTSLILEFLSLRLLSVSLVKRNS